MTIIYATGYCPCESCARAGRKFHPVQEGYVVVPGPKFDPTPPWTWAAVAQPGYVF